MVGRLLRADAFTMGVTLNRRVDCMPKAVLRRAWQYSQCMDAYSRRWMDGELEYFLVLRWEEHTIKKLTTVPLCVEDVHRMELILMHRCAICYNMNANDVYMI